MKVVFFGSDDYSLPHLEKLVDISDVVLIVTTPDVPRGRGRKLEPTPVKSFAIEKGIEVYDSKLKRPEFIEKLESLKPDVGIVASFGKMIPKIVFEKFRFEVFCVHPSLLPKYRGAAPMRRVLENGEKKSGVTIFKIVEKLDAGPIALQRSFEIGPFDTYGDIFEKSVKLGVDMLEEFFEILERGELNLKEQDESSATYAPKLEKEELKVDFNRGCVVVKDKIRSLDPKPGAFAFLGRDRVKLFGVVDLDEEFSGKPGEIVSVERDGAWISCENGAIKLKFIQFPGKNRIDFWSAKVGRKLKEGEILT